MLRQAQDKDVTTQTKLLNYIGMLLVLFRLRYHNDLFDLYGNICMPARIIIYNIDVMIKLFKGCHLFLSKKLKLKKFCIKVA